LTGSSLKTTTEIVPLTRFTGPSARAKEKKKKQLERGEVGGWFFPTTCPTSCILPPSVCEKRNPGLL